MPHDTPADKEIRRKKRNKHKKKQELDRKKGGK